MIVEEKIRTRAEPAPAERVEPAPSRPHAVLWTAVIGAVMVALAAGIALAMWMTGNGAEEAAQPAPTGQELMRRLVNEGYLPSAALEPAPVDETAVLEDLVNRGRVPAAALVPAETEAALLSQLVNQGQLPPQVLESVTQPLWTPEEWATLEAVRRGFVPAETIEEMLLTKRLINQGLIPAGSG